MPYLVLWRLSPGDSASIPLPSSSGLFAFRTPYGHRFITTTTLPHLCKHLARAHGWRKDFVVFLSKPGAVYLPYPMAARYLPPRPHLAHTRCAPRTVCTHLAHPRWVSLWFACRATTSSVRARGVLPAGMLPHTLRWRTLGLQEARFPPLSGL